MHDALQQRKPGGFLAYGTSELTFEADAGQLYSGVAGVRVSPEGDQVQILLDKTEDRKEALLSAADVRVVAKHFVTEGSVSLFPLTKDLPQPLQEV